MLRPHPIKSRDAPHSATKYESPLWKSNAFVVGCLSEVSRHEKNSSDSFGSVGFVCRTIGSSPSQLWNPLAIPVPCLDPFGLFRATVLRKLWSRRLFGIVLQLSQCRLLRVLGRLLLPLRDRLLSHLRQELLSSLL